MFNKTSLGSSFPVEHNPANIKCLGLLSHLSWDSRSRCLKYARQCLSIPMVSEEADIYIQVHTFLPEIEVEKSPVERTLQVSLESILTVFIYCFFLDKNSELLELLISWPRDWDFSMVHCVHCLTCLRTASQNGAGPISTGMGIIWDIPVLKI